MPTQRYIVHRSYSDGRYKLASFNILLYRPRTPRTRRLRRSISNRLFLCVHVWRKMYRTHVNPSDPVCLVRCTCCVPYERPKRIRDFPPSLRGRFLAQSFSFVRHCRIRWRMARANPSYLDEFPPSVWKRLVDVMRVLRLDVFTADDTKPVCHRF